jgi:hypothetical protein
MKSIFHQLCDLGERAEQIADAMQREPNHKLHHACVACRDFSNQIGTALAEAANKRLAVTEL